MLHFDPAVGIAIRSARKAAGLSQQRLPRASGISLRHLVAIERGANFTVAVLVAIARQLPALGSSAPAASPPNVVSVGDLFVSGGTITLNSAGALTVGSLGAASASASPPAGAANRRSARRNRRYRGASEK